MQPFQPLPIDPNHIAAAMRPWLVESRWFAQKGQAIANIAVHDCVQLPCQTTPTAFALVDVSGGAAQQEAIRYAVPMMSNDSAAMPLADAAASPEFLGWLIRAMLTETTLAGRAGRFVGHHLAAGGSAIDIDPLFTVPLSITCLGGDASNTSLIVESVDWSVIVKLMRRCRTGIHPEVEVGTFFAQQTAWSGTPRLMGWLEYVSDGSDSTAIATVHEFAAGCTSAWDRLADLLAQQAQPATAGCAADSDSQAHRLVAAIGHTTAAMHHSLASRGDLPAFAPQAVTPAHRRTAASHMVDHALHVFSLLASGLPDLPPPLAARLKAVAAKRDQLIAQLEALATLEISPASPVQIRVHGDYHLGQVLVAGENHVETPRVLVIDFEGEPGRTLAERRAITSALKDVAGMCRSFDYLLRHMRRRPGAVAAHPDSSTLDAIEATFLTAYRETACGQPWWPADPQEACTLLAIYKLDKALYELAYELRNRPDWIEVPLAAIEAFQRNTA